jgi:hypothetical protein
VVVVAGLIWQQLRGEIGRRVHDRDARVAHSLNTESRSEAQRQR